VRRDGWQRTTRTLAREPERFGPLRNGRLARLRPAARWETREAAGRAADRLGKLSGVRRQIRELQGEVRLARRVISPARRRALRAVKLARRLPSHRLLQSSLARVASRVGLEAAGFVLAPTPMRALRLAVRMVREVGRAMGR
jgi:hypothetical protein